VNARMADPAVVQRRIDRLRAEIAHENVPLSARHNFPAELQASFDMTTEFLCEEIIHARYVEVHEGYRPSYGVLLVPDIESPAVRELDMTLGTSKDASEVRGGGTPLQDRESETGSQIEDLRLVVDGERTFLLRDLHGRFRLLSLEAAGQIELLEVARELSAICVQRGRDGRIEVITSSIVCINEGYDWRWLVTASEMLSHLTEALNPPAAVLEEVITALAELLDLSVHLLSPRGIGATFVWRVSDTGSLGVLSNSPKSPPVPLNVLHRQDRYAVAALLASVDGACLVESDGTLASYWAMLDPSGTAKRLVAEMGGTRHTSAKRFSYDEPGSIVVVISEDGPVSVFSDGALIARFADATRTSSTSSWTTDLVLGDGADVESRLETVDCPTCGKILRVRVATHPEAMRTANVDCPVCDTADLMSFEHIVDIQVHVARTWSG
jgi:DNA integrity scanning protein DisA with diadenylate cyclase activity